MTYNSYEEWRDERRKDTEIEGFNDDFPVGFLPAINYDEKKRLKEYTLRAKEIEYKMISENLRKLSYNFKPPYFVEYVEAYSLFYYLVTGRFTQTHFVDPRHKWIFMVIGEMYRDVEIETYDLENISMENLMYRLYQNGWMKRAGGEEYIKKIFRDFHAGYDLYNWKEDVY